MPLKATRLYFHVGTKSDTITIVSNSIYRGSPELGNQDYYSFYYGFV